MNKPSFIDDVVDHVNAGYQCLLIPTAEEARCCKDLEKAAERIYNERDKKQMGIVFFDTLSGFSGIDKSVNTKNIVEALQAISDSNLFGTEDYLMVFKDIHPSFSNPDVRRAIRGMAARLGFSSGNYRRPLILLQPTPALHAELASCVTTIEFSLPTHEQLLEVVAETNDDLKKSGSEIPAEHFHEIAQGMLGLTRPEASDCLSLCTVRHGGYCQEMLGTIEEAKANVLRRSEILSYVPRYQLRSASEIGGYDELVAFITQRSLAYTQEAARVKLDMPKGIVVCGIPGVGKSVVTECIASVLGLPLINFDFSAVFNSLVGASEQRTREVIALASAMGGCVLVIDEADKALGGAVDSTGDSGVTRRVFGQLLNWLAKKNDRTFVVMTMNRIKGMPPELLRRGRFDEIFYVDVPTEEERRVIFEIHFRKRNVDPGAYSETEWKAFIKASHDMVGSEIEEAVKSSRFAAFQKDRAGNAEPTAAQVMAALEELALTRVTQVDPENIKQIRDFGRDKARPVSSARKPKKGKQSRGIDIQSPFRGDN